MFRSDFDGVTKVGDGAKGVMESATFVLGSGSIDFDCSGDGGYIALVLAESEQEVLQLRPNHRSTTMKAGGFSVEQLAQFVGREVKFRLVDSSLSSWGWIAVDNIRYPVHTDPGPGVNVFIRQGAAVSRRGA